MKIKNKYQNNLNISTFNQRILYILFDNKFIQELIEKVLNRLKNINFISRYILKWKFLKKNFRNANEVVLGKNYIKFENNKIYSVTINNETRNLTILETNSQIEGSIFLNETSIFRFGINVILSQKNLKNIKNDNIKVKLTFKLKEDKTQITKTFSFPIGNSKHGAFGGGQIKNWLDFNHVIKIKKPQDIHVTLALETIQPFLMFDKNTNFKNKAAYSRHKLAVSAPFVAPCAQIKKKIILLSIESMTDPHWLMKNFDLKLNIPSFNNLVDESESFSCAVPQVDCTRPFAHSILYGLLPSQHKQGSYKYDLDSSKNRTIAEVLKKKNFYTTAGLPYRDHFDPDFGLSKGFDTYFCTKRPEQSDAPDASWILRSINSQLENNHFIFSHIQRLHPPFLSLNDNQYPNSFKLSSLNETNNRNWINLYIDQLIHIDQQINILVSSLKSQNLYNNTMIVLLGDHGVGIPPLWKKTNNEFAHFEMRGRVPLLIKHADWSAYKTNNKHSNPVNATLNAYDQILKSLELQMPKNVSKSRQYISLLEGYAIMETIFHPNENNYSISIRNNYYKLWIEYIVDWKLRKINKESNRKFFKIDNNTEEDISSTSNNQNKDSFDKMYKLINSFVEKNFSEYFYEL